MFSVERAVILSRRHLLASFGLALPAAALVAPRANAATASVPHKKHKSRHGTVQASHKHHKPAATPATTQG